MNEALTVLAPNGVALAPGGVVLVVRTVYPTYTDEDAGLAPSTIPASLPVAL